MSDCDLVRACLEGDRKAWEMLLHRYQRLLYSIPRRCGLTEDDAADVFQTVCLRLLENLERLREHERIAAWLITTATRESWRVQRQRRRYTSLPGGDPDRVEGSPEESFPADDPLPQEQLIQLEEEQMVREAFHELSERCRALLECLYYTDPAPSYAEIAQRLQMPEGSIGPARARCLQQLKKILQQRGF